MKLNKKLVIALFVASTSLFGFSSAASAGEGGAASAASFTLNGSNVTGAAVGAAVGKQSAGATATNNGSSNTAAAVGTAGTLEVETRSGLLTGLGSTLEAGATDTNGVGNAQANGLQNTVDAPSSFSLDQD